jgi:hypothetical protein
VISDLRTIASKTPFGVASWNSRAWPTIEDSQRRASARAQALGMTKHRNDSRIMRIRVLVILVVIAPAFWPGIQLVVRKKSKQ